MPEVPPRAGDRGGAPHHTRLALQGQRSRVALLDDHARPPRRPPPRPLPVSCAGDGILRWAALVAVAASLLAAPAASGYPRSWRRAAACIHRHESVDWRRRTDWLGRPSRQHGGMQIDLDTWAAYAPRWWPRDPADATPAQQLLVAWRIWLGNGRRWGGRQWPNTARICGVR